MPKVTKQVARKDYPGIKKGQTYYKWKFRYGPICRSLTRPRPSQLTQSEFLGEYYSIREEMEDADPSDPSELRDMAEDWAGRILDLGEECEDRRSNMPDHLQDSETGELLTARYEGMEQWSADVGGVDLDETPALPDDLPEGVEYELVYHEGDWTNDATGRSKDPVELLEVVWGLRRQAEWRGATFGLAEVDGKPSRIIHELDFDRESEWMRDKIEEMLDADPCVD